MRTAAYVSERIRLGAAFMLSFLIHLALSYPGIMTWDSKDQYAQALSGHFNDWHPPIMAFVWRMLLPISEGGSAILFLNLMIYWAGLFVFADQLVKGERRIEGWLCLAIGWLPPTFLMSAYIHKDVGMAVCLTAASAIIFRSRLGTRNLGFVEGLCVVALLSYATLLRSNAAFAVAPLTIYAIRASHFRNPFFLAAGSLVAVAVLIPTASLINHRILKAKNAHAEHSLIEFDLAGITHYSRDPGVIAEQVPIEFVDHCYTPALWDTLAHDQCGVWLRKIKELSFSKKGWMAAIAHHPIAYLDHRIASFNEELLFWTPPSNFHWNDPNTFANLRHGYFEEENKTLLLETSRISLFSPSGFFILGLVVFFVILVAKIQMQDVFAESAYFILASSCAYTLGFLVVGVANLYRYQQYGITAALLGSLLFMASIGRAGTMARLHKAAIFLSVAATIAVATVARVALA